MNKIIISGIKMPMQHTEADVLTKAQKMAHASGIRTSEPYIYKKSLDARRKTDIHYVYSVILSVQSIEGKVLPSSIKVFEDSSAFEIAKKTSSKKVLVVGSGP